MIVLSSATANGRNMEGLKCLVLYLQNVSILINFQFAIDRAKFDDFGRGSQHSKTYAQEEDGQFATSKPIKNFVVLYRPHWRTGSYSLLVRVKPHVTSQRNLYSLLSSTYRLAWLTSMVK